jgi:hypothetical protein
LIIKEKGLLLVEQLKISVKVPDVARTGQLSDQMLIDLLSFSDLPE